jgi:hypothetical protein
VKLEHPLVDFAVPRVAWNGVPQSLLTVWRLRKGKALLSCRAFSHPAGWELRIDYDGSLVEAQSCGSIEELRATAGAWQECAARAGWTDERA